jgi:hypothetical protein
MKMKEVRIRQISGQEVADVASSISEVLRDSEAHDNVDIDIMALSMLQVAVAMLVWAELPKATIQTIADEMWEKSLLVKDKMEKDGMQ